MIHELEKKIVVLKEEIDKNREYLDKTDIAKDIADLEGLTTAEGFWDDRKKADEIHAKLSVKKKLMERWDDLVKRIVDLQELAGIMKETKDMAEIKDLEKDINKLEKDFQKAETGLFMNGEYDDKDCILSIHAGTGGVDAMDWAEMLMRMYGRYIEKKGFKSELLDITSGDEAGIKSVSMHIKGEMVYGSLRSESGVHRLVRQSPFNSKNLRQTSFALVEVVPFVDKDIDIEIEKDDLRIDMFRASGHGGQGVNTTDSAVRITHIPTGMVVACQNERSQLQNKEIAMKILKSKLFALREQELQEEKAIMKGDTKQGSWGNQIRSYVFHPYKMVKDHRTDWETSDVEGVMDGDLEEFVEAYLRWSKNKK